MIIVQASAADVAELVTLVNGAYRGASARAGWSHEAALIEGQRTDPATLTAEMAGGATILIAREPGAAAPVGCVLLEPLEAPGDWALGMLAVSPLHQAGGAGRVLLEAGEQYALAQSAERIVLKVIHLRQSLIAWYERRGYRRCHETALFPYGDTRFGIPRRPDLHFTMLEKRVASSRPR